MASSNATLFSLPCTPPTSTQAEALCAAARYLQRAGTEVRSGLIGRQRPGSDTGWMHDLPSVLLSAANLCDAMAECAGGDSPLS